MEELKKIRMVKPKIKSGYFTNENDEPKNLIEDGRIKVNTGAEVIEGTTDADNKQKMISDISNVILGENPDRKSAKIINDSDKIIYISLADIAKMNKGIRLDANGGNYPINADNLYTGAVSGISADLDSLQYLNCEDTAHWANFGGGDTATFSVDNVDFKEGVGSLKFSVDVFSTVHNFCSCKYTGQANLDISLYTNRKLTFWLYLDAEIYANLDANYPVIYLFTTSDANRIYFNSSLVSQLTGAGWNYIELDLASPDGNPGSFDFSDFDYIRFGIKYDAGTSDFVWKLDDIKFTRFIPHDSKMIHNCDTKVGNGNWHGDNDTQNVVTDAVTFKEGIGSIKWDVDVSKSANHISSISNHTMASVDLSDYENTGKIRVRWYCDDPTYIRLVSLWWGTGVVYNVDHWKKHAYTQYDGSAFVAGWNLLELDWATATPYGTPDAADVHSLFFYVYYSASQPDAVDWRIDDIHCVLPKRLIISESPVNNLVGHWKFNEETGMVTRDSSGQGNDGILVNMEEGDWVDGKFGKALQFDGALEHVLVSSANYNFQAADSFSISCWIKTSIGTQQLIIDNRTGNYPYYILRVLGDVIQFQTGTDAPHLGGITGGTVVSDGEWHHIVAVRNVVTGKLYLYVNGNEDATPATDNSGNIGTNRIKIGCHFSSTGFGIVGTIDDVRIYNKILTQAEITALYEG